MNELFLFNSLEGRWTVTRHIESQGMHGIFNGTAIFTRETENIFLYSEQGHIDFNGYQGEASRQYRYVLGGDGILIYYDDGVQKGDILHDLRFLPDGTAFSARHCHVCGQDIYDVTMTITPHQTITMVYTVKGANKDYMLSSVLTIK